MFEHNESVPGFTGICTLRLADPTGERGVGFHRLNFDARFSFAAAEADQMRLTGLALDFQLGMYPVGRASHSGIDLPSQLATTGGAFTTRVALDLSSSQLSALEDVRAGEDLVLRVDAHLQFAGYAGYGGHPFWTFFSGEYRIPQSVWVKQVLKPLAFQDYLLLEVPLSTHPQSAGLERAVGHLQKARDLASKGEFLHAVAECRPAMEEIERVYGLKPMDRATLAAYSAGDPKKAQQLDKASRFAVWRYGLASVIHAAHHKEEGHDPWEWGRAGAMAVITATAAMIEASYSPDARDTAGVRALVVSIKASRPSGQRTVES